MNETKIKIETNKKEIGECKMNPKIIEVDPDRAGCRYHYDWARARGCFPDTYAFCYNCIHFAKKE